ncbi:MAG TPA: hypothetical protein VJG83_04285 [archaeon]|nr:hypothetical protein [archaeon]
MVSNEVVAQTVKRMIASGVDDDTIKMTLKGIGLDDSEISSVIASAKGVSEEQDEADSKVGQEDADEGSVEGGEVEEGEQFEPDLDTRLDAISQEQSAQHATTHTVLDEHAQKMEDMHDDISSLHEKIDSSPKFPPEAIAKISALDKRMSALEKEISETKANTLALKDILQKILETNRKTLIEVQKK